MVLYLKCQYNYLLIFIFINTYKIQTMSYGNFLSEFFRQAGSNILNIDTVFERCSFENSKHFANTNKNIFQYIQYVLLITRWKLLCYWWWYYLLPNNWYYWRDISVTMGNCSSKFYGSQTNICRVRSQYVCIP